MKRPEIEVIVRAMEAAAPDDCTLDDLRAMAARLHDAGLVGTATERFAMVPTATRLLMLDRDAWKGVAMRREKLHDELASLQRSYDKAVEQLEVEMDGRIAANFKVASFRRLLESALERLSERSDAASAHWDAGQWQDLVDLTVADMVAVLDGEVA